jgi:hypothetical protein
VCPDGGFKWEKKGGAASGLVEKKWWGGGVANGIHAAWKGRGTRSGQASQCDISTGPTGAGGGWRRRTSLGDRGKGGSITGARGPAVMVPAWPE